MYNNYYHNDNQQNDIQNQEYQYPQNYFPGEIPPKKQKSNRRMFAGILCACLLTSSVMGFGGGYLAANLNSEPVSNTMTTTSQSQSQSQTQSNSTPTATTSSVSGQPLSVSQIVSEVSDSVVEIQTEVSTTYFMQQVTAESAGSGVIISEDGYIITNNHVIENARNITVRLKDGQSYPAVLVGTDAQTDIAVIKVEASGLKAATIGSSADLQVGDETVAIGNPLGELGGTVTNGIISALDRDVTIDQETMTLLQTNAAINPGNSGGGLFNNRGELIGIVVAKSSGTGIEGLGFAVPIDIAYSVAQDLISNGYVGGRAELGISVMDIQDERTAFLYRVPQLGVYIANVQEGSAAQQAGLQVGDAILAVGEAEVSSSAQLRTQLKNYKAGDTIQLTVLRDNQKQTLSVTLQENVPEEFKQKTPAV